MSTERGWRTVRADADGVRVRRPSGVRGSVWWLAVGIIAAAIALVVGVRRLLRESPEPPERSAAAGLPEARRSAVPQRLAAGGDGAARAPTAPVQRIPFSVRRRPDAAPPRREARELPPRAAAVPEDAADSEVEEDASGAPAEQLTGIQLFPAPGTDPPKVGIVVPEEFELPEGYVRHYQATDDGKMLPAILMFHPDYEFVDAQGEPIAVPENRVVPPELAPPSLPIEMLVVPEVRLDDGPNF